uniref:Metallophos domain-containing protein n=1 Tax=Macrostomum lignano TaxID=282301 RepID=A0A1I8FM25_9PLAT
RASFARLPNLSRELKEESNSSVFDFSVPYSAPVNREAARMVIERARTMTNFTPANLNSWTIRALNRDYTSSDEETPSEADGQLRVKQLPWESEELRGMKARLDEIFYTSLADEKQRAEVDRVHRDGQVLSSRPPLATVLTGPSPSPNYGTNRFDRSASGVQEKFVDGGSAKRVIYYPPSRDVRSEAWTAVRLPGGQRAGLVATCSCSRLQRLCSDWPARFAVYGDMGNNTNGKSIPFLQKEAQSGDFDMVLHRWRFSPTTWTPTMPWLVMSSCVRWSPLRALRAYVPYMTCPGNHESAYNFSNYRRRFSMPGGDGEGSFF